MESLYFGPAGERLFGVYHPAAGERLRPCGVILCHPMGQEQIRSHGALFRLARLLSGAGFHTLRFDFYGSGDSEGDCLEVSLGRWIENLRLAMSELLSGAGVAHISFVGLRLGASVALRVGLAHPAVKSVVVWEPVVSGGDYLAELRTQHRAWLRGSFARATPGRAMEEILGFPLTAELAEELQALDLLALPVESMPRILIVDNAQGEAAQALNDHLARGRLEVSRQLIEARAVWHKSTENLEGGLLPSKVLDAIVSWLGEVHA